jgi:hypothetical protein
MSKKYEQDGPEAMEIAQFLPWFPFKVGSAGSSVNFKSFLLPSCNACKNHFI